MTKLDKETERNLVLIAVASSQTLYSSLEVIGTTNLFPQALRNLSKRLSLEIEKLTQTLYKPRFDPNNQIEEKEEMDLYNLVDEFEDLLSKIVKSSNSQKELIILVLNKDYEGLQKALEKKP